MPAQKSLIPSPRLAPLSTHYHLLTLVFPCTGAIARLLGCWDTIGVCWPRFLRNVWCSFMDTSRYIQLSTKYKAVTLGPCVTLFVLPLCHPCVAPMCVNLVLPMCHPFCDLCVTLVWPLCYSCVSPVWPLCYSCVIHLTLVWSLCDSRVTLCDTCVTLCHPCYPCVTPMCANLLLPVCHPCVTHVFPLCQPCVTPCVTLYLSHVTHVWPISPCVTPCLTPL
jgi:DNA helicase MCM8